MAVSHIRYSKEALASAGSRLSLPLVGRVGPKVRGGVLATAKPFEASQACPSRLLRSHPPHKGEGKAATHSKIIDEMIHSPPSALPGISPTRGEIDWLPAISSVATGRVLRRDDCRLFSPLVGEMGGSPEGGK